MTAITERITDYTTSEPREMCVRCGRFGRVTLMLRGIGAGVFLCANHKTCERRARRRIL